MAKKILVNVRNCDITTNENLVYKAVEQSGRPVSYKDIQIEGLSSKAIISLLARLDTHYGFLKKNEPKKGTFYKINVEKLQNTDLSKITDKEKSILNKVKDLQNTFNYKDVVIENLSPKAIIATLARLNTTYGVLDKVVETGLTTYELVEE